MVTVEGHIEHRVQAAEAVETNQAELPGIVEVLDRLRWERRPLGDRAGPDLLGRVGLTACSRIGTRRPCRPMTILAQLRSRSEGLSAEEAAGLLEVVGPNRLPGVQEPHILQKLAKQFTHFFALMLWVAAVLAAVWGGMPQLAVAIVVVVIVNGLLLASRKRNAPRGSGRRIVRAPAPAFVSLSCATDAEAMVVGSTRSSPVTSSCCTKAIRSSADARLLVGSTCLLGRQLHPDRRIRARRSQRRHADDQPEPRSAADQPRVRRHVRRGGLWSTPPWRSASGEGHAPGWHRQDDRRGRAPPDAAAAKSELNV